MAAAVAVAAVVTAVAVAAGLAAGPAIPASAAAAHRHGHGHGLPTPRSGEWWFRSWLIQSRVWPLTTGRGITVAVLDTGVQANVPNLRGAVVPGGDMTGAGTNGMTDDDRHEDGHGTAMAALIAGNGRGTGMAGIAPNAKIMPIRVGGMDGVGAPQIPQTAAAGIRFAVVNGAQVINLSLGVPAQSSHSCDPMLQQAIAYAIQHNVVVVAGAGDAGGSINYPAEPASCAGVLAVGGVNPNLTLWRGSERQPYVDVAAPGNQIGWSGRNGRYFPGGFGTSQACAFVSGEAALVRSRYPKMPWWQVDQRIVDTALRRGKRWPNKDFGYGIVRIAGAVNARKYPIGPHAPNPVLAGYRAWLKSPKPTPLRPRHLLVTFAPTTGLSNSARDGLIFLIAVGLALIALVVVAVVIVRRRGRRHTVSEAGVPGAGVPGPGAPGPGTQT